VSCNVKFSEINHTETWGTNARDGLMFLLKNGYIKISAYFEIEANKIIKCLKILGIRHKINFIAPINNNSNGDYEFMLDFFEDDRE
jgi:hypothetical protein